MKCKLYMVRDKVADVFHPPFVESTDESCKRSFAAAMAKLPNPADYEVYFVGSFDCNTGVIAAESVLTLVCRGDQLPAPVNPQTL